MEIAMTDAVEQRPVALVTGGGVRVGQAIVHELAARGYRVAIHANTSLDRAQELVTELTDKRVARRPRLAPSCATRTPRGQ